MVYGQVRVHVQYICGVLNEEETKSFNEHVIPVYSFGKLETWNVYSAVRDNNRTLQMMNQYTTEP